MSGDVPLYAYMHDTHIESALKKWATETDLLPVA